MSKEPVDKSKSKSLDFDFSDVAGKQTKKKAKSQTNDILSKGGKKKEKDKKLSGIILSVPVEGGFLTKDMFECTAQEFYNWAKTVYPMVTAEVERFESLNNRVRAFKQIQNYHYSNLTKEQRETVN